MEESNVESDNSEKKSMSTIFVGGIILVLLLAGGGFYFLSLKRKAPEVMETEGGTTVNINEENTESLDESMSEQSVENGNSMQATDESSMENLMVSEEGAQVFSVEGGNYYFKPNVITVKLGEKVTINFNNVGGMHDFVLPDFDVKTKITQTGESATVEFTPDKKGKFEFYCSVANHQQLGMVGTLVVE